MTAAQRLRGAQVHTGGRDLTDVDPFEARAHLAARPGTLGHHLLDQ